MIFTMSQKNVHGVLKSETLYIPSKARIYSKSKLLNLADRFPSEALLCCKDELALLNMRWYLTHLLKVLHLCWFNKRNNKRFLFVDDFGNVQKSILKHFVKSQYDQTRLYPEKNICFSPRPALGRTRSEPLANKDLSSPKFGQLFPLICLKSSKPKSGLQNFKKVKPLALYQNSRLPFYSIVSNSLGGLFSNSHLAFKQNHIFTLSCLLDSRSIPNKLTFKTPPKATQKQHSNTFRESFTNPNQASQTCYERILEKLFKKHLISLAQSPWKSETDVVFFTNPGKTLAMVEQIRRLGICTIGLVDGKTVTSQSRYNLSKPNSVVDYAIIGNANSLYFVQAVLSKCLTVMKKTNTPQVTKRS